MAKCILCNSELKFINTPMFGSGILSDGNVVCTSCHSIITSTDSKVGSNLKHYSVDNIKSMLHENRGINKSKANRKGCQIAIGFFLIIFLLVYTCSVSSDEIDDSNSEFSYRNDSDGDIIYITNGGYLAAISEEYLDEAFAYLAYDDSEALESLIETKVVFHLNPNIEVYLIGEYLTGKAEFRFKNDKNTIWTRREALGKTKVVGKEMTKEKYRLQYQEEWPFKVEKVMFRCIEINVQGLSPIHAFILEVNGIRYAINGTARNWAQKNGYGKIEDILNQPIPLSRIIQDGLDLCE